MNFFHVINDGQVATLSVILPRWTMPIKDLACCTSRSLCAYWCDNLTVGHPCLWISINMKLQQVPTMGFSHRNCIPPIGIIELNCTICRILAILILIWGNLQQYQIKMGVSQISQMIVIDSNQQYPCECVDLYTVVQLVTTWWQHYPIECITLPQVLSSLASVWIWWTLLQFSCLPQDGSTVQYGPCCGHRSYL